MKPVWILRFFFNLPLFVFTKIFLVKEIKGKENLRLKNFILTSNHQSYLDVLVNGSICFPRQFYFIGQVDGWQGLIGILVKIFYFIEGVIPLDRRNEESRKQTLEKAVKVLKGGSILIIYPEGRRSRNGQLQKGRLGTAKIFLKTEVPILSMGIKKNFKINVGKPMFFEEELKTAKSLDENSKEYSELLQKITDRIMKEISSLIT